MSSTILRGLLLATILVATLAACGQKGPLYLPQDPERAGEE